MRGNDDYSFSTLSSPQAQDHYPQQTLPLKQQSFVLGTVVNVVIHRSQVHCRRFDDVGQCTDKACHRIAGILQGNLSGSSFSCAWVYQLVILSQSGTRRRRQLELMAIYAVLQTRDDSNCWQEMGPRLILDRPPVSPRRPSGRQMVSDMVRVRPPTDTIFLF